MIQRFLAVLAVSLALSPALAHAALVDFEVRNKVMAGDKQKPHILVSASDDADKVVLELRRDDGKRFTFRTGRLNAGTIKRFDLDVPRGREYQFSGSMQVVKGKEVTDAEVKFAAEIITPATISVPAETFDPAGRTMTVFSTRRTAKVVVQATGDRGEDLGRTEVAFDDVAAKEPLAVTWKQKDKGRLMKLHVDVYDPDGFYYGADLFPWHIDIPHDEVNFATGSHAIEKAEEPKLLQSLDRIEQAVAAHGQFASLKLFVVGHTDTVGSLESNRTLSFNRARSISEYFRRQGLSIPVFFDGLGEEAQKVPTPDETDEIKNRRAEYIVAVEPPAFKNAPREARWKSVR